MAQTYDRSPEQWVALFRETFESFQNLSGSSDAHMINMLPDVFNLPVGFKLNGLPSVHSVICQFLHMVTVAFEVIEANTQKQSLLLSQREETAAELAMNYEWFKPFINPETNGWLEYDKDYQGLSISLGHRQYELNSSTDFANFRLAFLTLYHECMDEIHMPTFVSKIPENVSSHDFATVILNTIRSQLQGKEPLNRSFLDGAEVLLRGYRHYLKLYPKESPDPKALYAKVSEILFRLHFLRRKKITT